MPADHPPSGFQVLLTCRPLLIFAAAAVLFHFSNAAMLPLVGQKLALINPELGTTLMSVCIVVVQLVMVPVAVLIGHKADAWGRKPIFTAALAVLALRGALYPLSDNPYWLVSVQTWTASARESLACSFRWWLPTSSAAPDIFNVSQGAIGTAAGLGGALSTAPAGLIVSRTGYSAGSLFLAVVAAAGMALFIAMMPKTGPRAAALGAGNSNAVRVV